MWIQSHVLKRETLAAFGAAPIALWLTYLGAPNSTVWQVFGIVTLGWWFGVVVGIGDYQDMRKIPNHEIKWIDKTVHPFLVWLSHWMRFQPIPILARQYPTVHRWAYSALVVDNISMGLRGVYMLPMFILTGFALEQWHGFAWAMLLPIAFFWQAGLVYHFCRNIKVDHVFWCEWIDDAVRCVLLLAAIIFSA
jgi:hypothetical protein